MPGKPTKRAASKKAGKSTRSASNKTVATSLSVSSFLDGVEPPQKRADAKALLKLMKKVTGLKPVMWGKSIIGFGNYHYRYDSGHEGDMMMTGFSPRANALTLYIMLGFSLRPDLLKKLGKVKTGKSCLYIKKLEDVDLGVLEELIEADFTAMQEKYPG